MEKLKTFDEFNGTVYYSMFSNNEKMYIVIGSDSETASTDENFNETARAFAEQTITKYAGYDVTLTKTDNDGIYEITPMPSDAMDFMELIKAITSKALKKWLISKPLYKILEKTFSKHIPKTQLANNGRVDEPRQNTNLNPNDYDVYWNVIFDYDEKAWFLLIGEDEDSMSDDYDWIDAVYSMIDSAIPSYKLREEMESYYSIYHRGDKYDGKQVKYKPEANDFIKKMEVAFPMWGRSNIKHL